MSSDPPFFRRILNACKTISLPRSQYEGTLPISSPTTVTRTRSLTLGSTQNQEFNLYVSATEMEKLEYHPNGRSNLSEIIFSLTFQAALVVYLPTSGSQAQASLLRAAVVIAFTASSSVMFARRSYPRIAAIVEKIMLLCFALCFFVMTGVFFTASSIIWNIIGGLACALTMLAFLKGCST